jgi:hypothetical protein
MEYSITRVSSCQQKNNQKSKEKNQSHSGEGAGEREISTVITLQV